MNNVILKDAYASQNVWEFCIQFLENSGVLSFHSLGMLKSVAFKGVENGILYLEVSNLFSKEWIIKQFSSFIKKAIENACPEISDFSILVTSNKNKIPNFDISSIYAKQEFRSKKLIANPTLYKRYTFENFIEGKCNSEALNICKKVVLNPGDSKFNPLYISGASGLGKTHLLQAIATELQETKRKIRTLYCSAIQILEDYVKQFQGSAKEKLLAEQKFRDKYENAEMLLVDDIQLLAKKDGTQKVLLSIIERMKLHGRQIVFCSDRLPSTMDERYFKQRLLQKFSESFIVSLSVPDIETRLQVVKNKTKTLPIKDSERYEISRWIATPAVLNFRELEGKLNRLEAEYDILKNAITLSLVKRIFAPSFSGITIEAIAEATALSFRISMDLLLSDSRVEKVSLARKIAIYICREHSGESLKTIGDFFRRKHSTVISSCKSIEKEMQNSEQMILQIETIQNSFGIKNTESKEQD